MNCNKTRGRVFWRGAGGSGKTDFIKQLLCLATARGANIVTQLLVSTEFMFVPMLVLTL